ncbi:flagellar hook-length control protein FliK [Oryzihumus leptocrescens]|uniref:Flagellar hook-length control protein FliK n=1 Tax=Oryzihumus leptocrescens TaxID=297536 RepID=A0A542Z9H2_9MICO|nr:flagellar hook-length control protein FliK [Oryzihumus leptocrescens]TQL56981.1 flagellar hook-length control protein FliK [Oryzihumus leptocrescens]
MTAAIPAGAGPVLPGSAPGRAATDPATDATSVAFQAALSAVLPVPVSQDAATPAPAAGPAGVPSAGGVTAPGAGPALSAGPAFVAPSTPEPADPAAAPAPGAAAPGGQVSASVGAAPSTAQAAGVQWLAPATPVVGPDASAAGAVPAADAGTAAATDATGRPRAVVTGQAPAFVPAPAAGAFVVPSPGDRQSAVETPAAQPDPALTAAGVSGAAAAPGGGGEARDTGSSGSGDRPRTVLTPPVTPAFHPAAPAHVTAVELTAPTTEAPAGAPELPHHQVMTAVSPLLRGPDGEQSLRLQLHPQDLGAVNVTVELRRGEVAIHLHAADGAAADLLRDHLPDLRQQLEDQGLRAGALQVDTGSAGSADQGSGRQQPVRPDLPAPGRTPAPTSPTSHPTTAPAAAGALDLRM